LACIVSARVVLSNTQAHAVYNIEQDTNVWDVSIYIFVQQLCSSKFVFLM
jgi:hypothetical protein